MTTDLWTFAMAFVGAPLAVLVIGYVAVRLHERSDHGPHAAE